MSKVKVALHVGIIIGLWYLSGLVVDSRVSDTIYRFVFIYVAWLITNFKKR